MSLYPGAAVWIVIAAALAGLLVTTAVHRRRLPTVVDMVHWWLESWWGRLLMLAFWAAAGFHVFTQHP